MKFGGGYSIEKVDVADFERFAADIGVRPIAVRRRLSEIQGSSSQAWDAVFSFPELEAHSPILLSMKSDRDRRAMRLAR